MTGLPILTYHALDDSGRVTATQPSWFLATMAALHAEGFRCVRLSEWVEAGRPEVDRGFALAFDDGLASIRLAAEGLARFGFTATAFLVTGRMGRACNWDLGAPPEQLLEWMDVRDLRSAGFEFGAHTVSHPWLGSCGTDRIVREIVSSRDEIEARLGGPCPLFAYPYGDAPRVARDVVSGQFSAGFTTRLGFASGRGDASMLARVDAFYLRSPRRLHALISGRWGLELRALRAARVVRGGIAIAGTALRRYSRPAASVAAGGA